MGPTTQIVGGRQCPIRLFLAASDVAFAVASPFLALFVRNFFEGAVAGNSETFITYAITSALASLAILFSMGCSKATWRYFASGDAFRVAQAVVLGVAIGAMVSFAHDRLLGIARAVPFIQAIIQIAAFVGTRLLFRKLSGADRATAGKPKQVLVVGCSKTALTYLHAVRELSRGSIEVAGLLSENRMMVGQTIHGKRVLGTVADVGDVIATLQVHGIEVWKLAIASSSTGFARSDALAIAAATEKHSVATIDVQAALSIFGAPECEPELVRSYEATSWKPFYAFIKRSIDLTGALSLLLVVSPLMLLLCGVVALDVGLPVFFWQQRLGKDGKRLTVYKFRTMRSPLDSAGRRIPDTRRVSIVGRWLRKLRMDELPQLISILKGDMSFVGPRPLLPIDQPLDAARRLAVKPGLTGWAQVHGGNLVAIEDKNALDLWYVAHSSLWLDMEIALRTVRMLLQGDNLDSRRIEQAKIWMSELDFATGL